MGSRAWRTTSAKPTLLVRPLEGFRQLAPEPDTRNQPGLAHSLLVDFSSDRVDLDACDRHAVALPPFRAALHDGDHPPGAEELLLLEGGARPAADDCGWGLACAPGRAGSGCHSSGMVSPPRFSPWVARMDFGPGGSSGRPASTAMVCSFFGPGEPIQRDRRVGGAALDAVQPCDGQPLARLVVRLPSDRLVLEPSTASEAKATPAAWKGSAVPEAGGTTNLALFLRVCQ